MTPTEMNSLPLPPPPMETTMGEPEGQVAIREELYPCGVMRTRFQKMEECQLNNDLNQMSLLQQLPSQPPPLQALMGRKEAAASDKPRGKVTFNEYVHDVDNCQWEPLKGRPAGEDVAAVTSAAASAAEAATSCQRTSTDPLSYKEKDVSEWVLDSLRHCSSPTGATPTSVTANSTVTPASASLASTSAESSIRPKLYNGRTVPNCFSPAEVQAQMRLQQSAGAGAVAAVRKLQPPPPPTRSNGTYLSN